jgi:hypothetical protein
MAKAAPMQSDVDVRQGCLPVQDGFPEQDDISAISHDH